MSSIGGLSMRPGLPAIPKYSYINKRKNYILSMKQRSIMMPQPSVRNTSLSLMRRCLVR